MTFEFGKVYTQANNSGVRLLIISVWLDMRTSSTVDEVLSKVKNNDAEYLKPLCGLPISTYFSALKIKWLIDNVDEVRQAIKEDRCLFGTIDSWLIWVTIYYSYNTFFGFYDAYELN